jgi:hypothetical protein
LKRFYQYSRRQQLLTNKKVARQGDGKKLKGLEPLGGGMACTPRHPTASSCTVAQHAPDPVHIQAPVLTGLGKLLAATEINGQVLDDTCTAAMTTRSGLDHGSLAEMDQMQHVNTAFSQAGTYLVQGQGVIQEGTSVPKEGFDADYEGPHHSDMPDDAPLHEGSSMVTGSLI